MNIFKQIKRYNTMKYITNMRYKVMEEITDNLGKVVEEEDKIICYVDKNKCISKNSECTVYCYGIEKIDWRRRLADLYNLNKRICYVFEGVNTRRQELCIIGFDCDIVIKNCNIDWRLSGLVTNGRCTIDNLTSDTFFCTNFIAAKELIIKNINNKKINISSSCPDVEYIADKIEVIDSNIGDVNKKVKILFRAYDDMNIVNSNIIGEQIKFDAKKINVDENSSLVATEKVSLLTDEFNSINIDSPMILLNEEKIPNNRGKVLFRKPTSLLEQKRLELINLLWAIKNKCIMRNLKEGLRSGYNLDHQSVSKSLNRK